MAAPKTQQDRDREEVEEFARGPFSVLDSSLKSNSQILVSCRNNKKLLGKVRAFDRHMNMVLENVQEVWFEPSKTKGARGTAKRRYISKMFLRGDNVILVVKNPAMGGN